MTAQELIAKVLELDDNSLLRGDGKFLERRAELADAAPILARMLQKAIEQRDRAIDGAYRDCDVTPQIKEANAELDAIAKGEG